MKRRGLTMGEMVVAVGLLGILVVFVALLFTRLLAASTKGSHQTVGMLFAQRRIDAAQRGGPPNWGTAQPLPEDADGDFRETTSGEEGVYFQDDQSQTSFYYRFTADRIKADAMGSLYRLSVDVVWWPSTADVASKARRSDVGHGTGNKSVTLSRVFYHQYVRQ